MVNGFMGDDEVVGSTLVVPVFTVLFANVSVVGPVCQFARGSRVTVWCVLCVGGPTQQFAGGCRMSVWWVARVSSLVGPACQFGGSHVSWEMMRLWVQLRLSLFLLYYLQISV